MEKLWLGCATLLILQLDEDFVELFTTSVEMSCLTEKIPPGLLQCNVGQAVPGKSQYSGCLCDKIMERHKVVPLLLGAI